MTITQRGTKRALFYARSLLYTDRPNETRAYRLMDSARARARIRADLYVGFAAARVTYRSAGIASDTTRNNNNSGDRCRERYNCIRMYLNTFPTSPILTGCLRALFAKCETQKSWSFNVIDATFKKRLKIRRREENDENFARY